MRAWFVSISAIAIGAGLRYLVVVAGDLPVHDGHEVMSVVNLAGPWLIAPLLLARTGTRMSWAVSLGAWMGLLEVGTYYGCQRGVALTTVDIGWTMLGAAASGCIGAISWSFRRNVRPSILAGTLLAVEPPIVWLGLSVMGRHVWDGWFTAAALELIGAGVIVVLPRLGRLLHIRPRRLPLSNRATTPGDAPRSK